ncbi:MAG: erythromycin esterase family protein [Balneolaceae bacterium]|nr:erythromycin esterase family protein [Balneolaceae bacterium]MCH8550046.1 erythromycin esterase family protein [Balneolaceae bacterium]
MMKRLLTLTISLLLFFTLLPPVQAQDIPALLEQHAVSFDDDESLIALIESISDERLVLMGEASHGTSEFYKARAALSKELVKNHGFNYIAVEGDWPSFARINAYVKQKPNAPADIDEAMEAIDRWPLWMWKNQEVKELVEWLYEFNADLEPSERVGLYGIDVYDNLSAMDDVLEWVQEMDGEKGRAASSAYSCMTRYPDPGDYIRMVAQSGEDCSEDMEEVLEIVRSLEHHRDASRWEFFRAEHGAKVAINAEKHYRANLQQSAASWNYRASHFYLTAERLLDYYGPGSRGIIWAHNTHIGDARATEMGRAGMQNIGQLSREALGRDEVFAIGLGTYTGDVLAASNWEGAQQQMETPEARSGSWEAMMEETGIEQFYVTFTNNSELKNALDRWIPHRAIGVTFNPANEEGNYVQTVLPERYDAFIFYRNSGVLSPL